MEETVPRTAANARKQILLICVCFGLVCIVQALNIYLRVRLDTVCTNVTAESRQNKRAQLQEIDAYMSGGWLYFRGSVYKSSPRRLSWQESRQYCLDRDADLTIISNEHEQEFVSSMFKDRLWIGLSDLEQEGVWKWVDGSLVTTREAKDTSSVVDLAGVSAIITRHLHLRAAPARLIKSRGPDALDHHTHSAVLEAEHGGLHTYPLLSADRSLAPTPGPGITHPDNPDQLLPRIAFREPFRVGRTRDGSTKALSTPAPQDTWVCKTSPVPQYTARPQEMLVSEFLRPNTPHDPRILC
ncbi:hypothetical protein WMY93_000663 [Mugilogobius chulae]|uniref:C-type lectin domain-containing protein n=1 Tax=Mugilogobius chulae TaxID=88201 RepID=A0AAW0QAP3_9GOBI